MIIFFCQSAQSEEEWYHPLLVKLRRHLYEGFIYNNDLNSFNREYREEGDLVNIPGILMVQDGMSLEEAYKETTDRFYKSSNNFLDQREEIRATSGFYHPGIEKTLRFIEHVFGGNQNIFSYLTKRYMQAEGGWHMPDTKRINVHK